MYRWIHILVFLPLFCFGQDATDTVAYSLDIEQVVVTAQLTPTSTQKSIQRVHVVTGKSIERIGAVTLDQALKQVNSVRLINDPILGVSIEMRGYSGNNIAVLRDGIPVIGRSNGSIDISQLSLHNVERIEIVQGPQSSMYGNNTAGGVINIISKTKPKKTWNASLTGQLQSTGIQEYSGGIGLFHKGLLAEIDGRYYKFMQFPIDSLRIVESKKYANGKRYLSSKYPSNPKMQYALGSKLSHTWHKYVLEGTYRYTLEDVQDYGRIRRPSYKPYAQDRSYHTKRNDLSFRYKYYVSDSLVISSIFSKNRYDRVRNENRLYLESMVYDSLLRTTDSICFNQILAKADIKYNGRSSWNMTGGYSYTRESGEGGRLAARSAVDSASSVVIYESALYSNVQYSGYKNLDVALATRCVFHNIYKQALTGSLRAKYVFNASFAGRLSGAFGYRSPSLKELYLEFVDINHHIVGNINLKPEKSRSVQATLDYGLKSNLEISFDVHASDVRNRIALVEYSQLKYHYANTGTYMVYGLQSSVDYAFPHLRLSSSASIGWWTNKIDAKSDEVKGRSFDMTNQATVEYKGTTLAINHRYYGRKVYYRLVGKTIGVSYLAPYHNLDLSISSSVYDAIKVTLGIQNLLDITMLTIHGDASQGAHSSSRSQYLGSGISYFLRVGYTL